MPRYKRGGHVGRLTPKQKRLRKIKRSSKINIDHKMAQKLKLVYFDVRGKAELIRLVLHAAKVEFEDQRIQMDQWQTVKPTTPYGMLPYMEIDGKSYGESGAILRYVAKKYNMVGKDEIEALQADMVYCMCEDVRVVVGRFHYDSNLTQDQKKALKEKYVSEILPKFFEKFEKMLVESKSGFFAGDNLTFGDLSVVDIGDQAETEIPGVFDKFPKLAEHRQKVKSIPALSSYLTKRKDTPI